MISSFQKACIVGIGQTEFSKASGRSEQQLAAEAILAACNDAGIDPASIDGMTISKSPKLTVTSYSSRLYAI